MNPGSVNYGTGGTRNLALGRMRTGEWTASTDFFLGFPLAPEGSPACFPAPKAREE
jgi:hypothetical protein